MLAIYAMDFGGLVRRDHDDLDYALRAMASTATPTSELDELLDVYRLALAVHIVAEARVLARIASHVTRPRDALRWALAQVEREHASQRVAAEELTRVAVGTPAWYDRVLRLRIELLDHATREELMHASLEHHVTTDNRRNLASRFATERLHVLSTTSPLELARNVRAA